MNNNRLISLFSFIDFKKYKIFFAVACSALNKICDLVPEILIGISIDVIVNQQNSIIGRLGIGNVYHQLYVVGGLTAVFWIFESVFEYLYSITWRSIAQETQHMLRLKTFNHLQHADINFFENKTTGGLLNIVLDDINQLEQFISQVPNEIIQLTVNILAMGTIFLYVSPMLAFLSLLPIPFVIGIAYYFQKKLARLYAIVRETSGNLASYIAYRLQGISTIKSYTTEQYELKQFEKESNLYKEANLNAHAVNAEYIPIVRMAIMVGFIFSLVGGGIYALQGKIPINWYAALVFLTQRFLWPFTSVTLITDMYEKTLACAHRILSILSITPTVLNGRSKVIDPMKVSGEINVQNVSFNYQNGTPIFNNINVHIPARNTVGFVGSTGSGKSTIIKLLLRFYDSSAGSILLDNHDIKSLPIEHVRQSIGLVSQDVYLVGGTIADNIRYGTFDASDEMVIQAAQMAHAHDFIMSLPDGYNTVIQEHGKNFSGGQRQRISIARAIVKKSPILIFDEATSAVDNETEHAIQQSMARLAKDHTIIMIAHRLSTVKNADTIFVLEKGNIIESGNHEQLLHKNGAYARLWKLQGS